MNQERSPDFPPYRVWNFRIPSHTEKEEGLRPLFLHHGLWPRGRTVRSRSSWKASEELPGSFDACRRKLKRVDNSQLSGPRIDQVLRRERLLIYIKTIVRRRELRNGPAPGFAVQFQVLEAVADVRANTHVDVVVDKPFDHGLLVLEKVLDDPILQVIAVLKESVDIVSQKFRVPLVRLSGVNFGKSFIPAFHPAKLLHILGHGSTTPAPRSIDKPGVAALPSLMRRRKA